MTSEDVKVYGKRVPAAPRNRRACRIIRMDRLCTINSQLSITFCINYELIVDMLAGRERMASSQMGLSRLIVDFKLTKGRVLT